MKGDSSEVSEMGGDSSDSGSISPGRAVLDSDNHDGVDVCKFICLAWIDDKEENENDTPPIYIVLYPDLLAKGWGWHRLVPYYSGPVPWSGFKKYLKEYFNINKDVPGNICNCHKCYLDEPDLPTASTHDAASLCIKVEEELLNGCRDFMTPEDIELSHEISECARNFIKSVDESHTAAAGFVCIAREAELISHLLKCTFVKTAMINFCNLIRQSALNLLLIEKPESAGAMVGIAKEARYMCNHLSEQTRSRREPVLYEKYLLCQNIREATATVLTMLEDEFCFDTAVPCAESEEPMGIATANADPKQNYNMEVEQGSIQKVGGGASSSPYFLGSHGDRLRKKEEDVVELEVDGRLEEGNEAALGPDVDILKGLTTTSELKCQETDPKQSDIMDIDHCGKENNLKSQKKKKFKNGKKLNDNLNNASGKELKEKSSRKRMRVNGNEIKGFWLSTRLLNPTYARGCWLKGRLSSWARSIGSDDLLYLKEQMEAEEDAERLLRRTEKRAFAAFKKAAILADSTPAVPAALRVEPKPKSDIRQQDLLKHIVGIKPKRAKVSSPSEPAESNTPRHDQEDSVTRNSSPQNQSVPLSGDKEPPHVKVSDKHTVKVSSIDRS